MSAPRQVHGRSRLPGRRTVLGALASLPALSWAGEQATLDSAAARAADAPAGGKRELLLARGSKLVMIGDSITDTDRARPVGEGLRGAIGNGYVMLVDALLGAVYPELGIRVVNQGTSGDTVRDLKARWQRDVMDLRPDWVSIMIGANDVWRQFDLPRETEKHVLIEEFEKTLDELVRVTRPAVKGIVLMTPFYIEPSRQDAMRAQMDRYGAVVKALAGKHGSVFVDTQAAVDRVLGTYYAATLAWDRVHPNHIGCMVLARAFVDAIGFAWNR